MPMSSYATIYFLGAFAMIVTLWFLWGFHRVPPSEGAVFLMIVAGVLWIVILPIVLFLAPFVGLLMVLDWTRTRKGPHTGVIRSVSTRKGGPA